MAINRLIRLLLWRVDRISFIYAYMGKNMKNYQDYWKIDSCSLTFRVAELDYYDESIHDKWILVNSVTGEEDTSFSRQDYKQIDIKGVRYDIKFYCIQNAKTNERVRYINIIIYSRQLLNSYFEGITDNNLYNIYSNIMDTGLIGCSFQTFCEAKVSNIDFAIDSMAKPEQVELIYKQLESLQVSTAKSKPFQIGGRIHSYQFGMRKIGKKIMYSYQKPFFKLYSKLEDSRSSERKHVSDFYDKIGFTKDDLIDYYRFEMTVRDKVHLNGYLKRYWSQDNEIRMNLSSLCRMIEDNEFMKSMRIDMLQKYIKQKIVLNEDMEEDKKNPMDKVISNICHEVVKNSSMNISECVEYIMFTYFNGVGSRKTQYNYRRKITTCVKSKHIELMVDLNPDGLVGLLKDKGAIELHGERYDFNTVLAQLVL